MRTLYVLCVAVWLFFIMRTPIDTAGNWNFQVYRFNAAIMLSGHDAFTREHKPVKVPWMSWRAVDYTGAQMLAYVGMQWISERFWWVDTFGFRLWQLLWIVVAATVLYRLKAWIPLLLLTTHPVFFESWLVISWEDKITFLAIPLLTCYFIKTNRLQIAGAIVGFGAAFNGVTMFFIPAFAVYCWKRNQKEAVAYMVTAAAFTMMPYFPEALNGWQRRSMRMAGDPIWYSVFKLLPFYIHRLNVYASTFACGVITELVRSKRIGIDKALLYAVAIVTVFSINAQPQLGVATMLLAACILETSFILSAMLLLAVVVIEFQWAFFKVLGAAQILTLNATLTLSLLPSTPHWKAVAHCVRVNEIKQEQ